jgi:putative intracellular protease/amidase
VTTPRARKRNPVAIPDPAVATTTGSPVDFRRSLAVRDGNLVTGPQDFSGAETARLVIEAPGR